MADQNEDAVRKRVIAHMNADHQDSLIRYLRHQHDLDESTASNARLIDINPKQVILVASNKCYTLPMSPPMASLKESRERLIAMDEEARKALGLPPADGGHNGQVANGAAKEPSRTSTLVKRYVPPSGFHLVVFLACLATFTVFSRQEHVRPGSPLYDRALKHVPAFAEFCQRIQLWVFSAMLVIHTTEASFMGFGRLRKYGVTIGSPLWLTWVGSCFIEGFGSFQRLDQLVKREKEVKENHSH
ncbi:hypothetical protein NA57DRAFT_81636 [Rhizodiscina lignyota]|uniref:DUF2470 domain-containing protein n=1 Tax=Rhizodiscina lignyota TaxID=1504668 RepID=A0A9P4I6F8_9PEZI|nr:hypothetical protein NA57DRAFT_81636 [Rhizodiscina lignyota]